ncbi:ABC transporter ATP-binding protein [Spirochaeta isovalerica]|uniref:ABC-2 type transport system ATP-binding protein n=1 Tax=Spirochaeta isovalerica TaxID=150 RepID=A0A841RBC4_9SPIO|nr:ATP-binding cassette domain-containing protein [Spirochaeta isovalerica]MBB6480547.1 ABC-2 type transport system ATP-binding protein [Spirochaeta isovalerica]
MISIQELTKYYDDVCAVKDMSLDIPEGQIMGLLGPNGAGKSTTLRILTGYLPPSEGTIFVNGIDVRKDPIEAKKLIGYLPESSPIYPDMLVYDYLDYIAQVRGIDKSVKTARLKDLSGLCGIRDVMHKSVSSLSKGYKQRVGLALAMMSDPRILVLDEPTSGLDPNQIAEIRSIIKEIGKEKTVIFSTHILSEAEATCDRIVIVNKGKIAADGTMDELKSSARAEQKISLSLRDAKRDDAEKALSEIEGVTAVNCTEREGQLDFSLDAVRDLRAEVYLTVKNRDWVMLELLQEKKSLENIFRILTSEGK